MNGYLNTLSIESLSDAAICIIPGIGKSSDVIIIVVLKYFSWTIINAKIWMRGMNMNKIQIRIDKSQKYQRIVLLFVSWNLLQDITVKL